MPRKRVVRKFNVSKIKKGFSYNTQDIAKTLGISIFTAQRWIKEDGLTTIDDLSPALVYSEVLRQFVTGKNNDRKSVCTNSELFCLKCKIPRKPYKMEIIQKSPKMIQGICEFCGCRINKACTPNNSLFLEWTCGFKIVDKLPVLNILSTTNPLSIVNSKMLTNTSVENLPLPIKFNAKNERVKKAYSDCLTFARRKAPETVRHAISSICRFEQHTDFIDFKAFSIQAAKDFRETLYASNLSKSTILEHLTNMKEFLLWLRERPGYKLALTYDKIEYLNMSQKDITAAKSPKPKDYLEIEHLIKAIINMPATTDFELRDQTMLALLVMSGARDGALIALEIGDMNLTQNRLFQHINTKRGKGIITYLFNIDDRLKAILAQWIELLKNKYNFQDNDPLFPAVKITPNTELRFEADGFKKEPLKSTTTVREILKEALQKAGFRYVKPHSIRTTLATIGMQTTSSFEEMKAWSQNIGHTKVDTTLTSYGQVSDYRQKELVEGIDIFTRKKTYKLRNNPKFQYLLSLLDSEEKVEEMIELMNIKNIESKNV